MLPNGDVLQESGCEEIGIGSGFFACFLAAVFAFLFEHHARPHMEQLIIDGGVADEHQTVMALFLMELGQQIAGSVIGGGGFEHRALLFLDDAVLIEYIFPLIDRREMDDRKMRFIGNVVDDF